jgi:hypothetical protein
MALNNGNVTPNLLKSVGAKLGVNLLVGVIGAGIDLGANSLLNEGRVRATGGNAPYASNEVKDTMKGVEQVMQDMLLKPEKTYQINYMNNRIRNLLNRIQINFGTKFDKYNNINPQNIKMQNMKY